MKKTYTIAALFFSWSLSAAPALACTAEADGTDARDVSALTASERSGRRDRDDRRDRGSSAEEDSRTGGDSGRLRDRS